MMPTRVVTSLEGKPGPSKGRIVSSVAHEGRWITQWRVGAAGWGLSPVEVVLGDEAGEQAHQESWVSIGGVGGRWMMVTPRGVAGIGV